MRDIDIPLPAKVSSDAVECAIEQAVVENGLEVRLKGTLKKHPGCIHWHVKQGRKAGTLEITLWPEQSRAWFTIQSGRRADWIEDAVSRLSELLRTRLDTD